MNQKEIPFEALEYSDLYVDCIYKGGKVNSPLKIDCALEAKCYGKDNSVGVRQMSRLILRIRYRQFGIMMTTSYVDKQAYSEVVEDGHPILIVTAADIAGILRRNSITTSNIDYYLKSIDEENEFYMGKTLAGTVTGAALVAEQ